MSDRVLYIFKSAILAGIAIALGGFVYLTVGGVAGAILFSFGLLTVVNYKLHLFTGKSGYFNNREQLIQLFLFILVGNVIGCWITSLIATDAVIKTATALTISRLNAGYLTNFLMAIPCGFIMTTAVEFGNKGKFLPLLFGVPLFILCGFRHSIADAFYYCCYGIFSHQLFIVWLLIVLGNFIGCNLYRTVISKY